MLRFGLLHIRKVFAAHSDAIYINWNSQKAARKKVLRERWRRREEKQKEAHSMEQTGNRDANWSISLTLPIVNLCCTSRREREWLIMWRRSFTYRLLSNALAFKPIRSLECCADKKLHNAKRFNIEHSDQQVSRCATFSTFNFIQNQSKT